MCFSNNAMVWSIQREFSTVHACVGARVPQPLCGLYPLLVSLSHSLYISDLFSFPLACFFSLHPSLFFFVSFFLSSLLFLSLACSHSLSVCVCSFTPACVGMLVVSSHETVPTEQFQKLSHEQHRIQHSGEYTYPKWFIPNTLKYYVLLHDISDGDEKRFGSHAPVYTQIIHFTSGRITPPCVVFPNVIPYFNELKHLLHRADSIYEDMKQRYGTQCCYLLKINSGTGAAGPDEQMPDPWSQYLQKNHIYSSVSPPATFWHWHAFLRLKGIFQCFST